MNRTVSARLLVGVTLALVALTGCQAGRGAATAQDYNPVDGRNVNVPAGAQYPDPYMAVRNVVVVSEGGAAALVMTLVNNTGDTDTLDSAKLGGQDVLMPGGSISIAPGQAVNIGSDAGAVAGVKALDIDPGHWADLELNFVKSGTSKFQVLVVPPGDEYVPDLEADVIDLFETAAASA